MATFNINDFKTEMWNTGVVRPHSFIVDMNPPKVLQDAGGFNNTRRLSMRCESAQLPDVTLGTQEILRYGYGPMEGAPYTAVFSGVSLTFVLDRTSYVYRFFYHWLNSIVNFNTSRGMRGVSPLNRDMKAYEVGYKDDITTDISINVFDEFARPVIVSTMHRAFPKAINAMDLNWGSVNDVVKMTVALSFREFSSQIMDNPQPVMESPFSSDVANGRAPQPTQPLALNDVRIPTVISGLPTTRNA